MPVLEIYDQLPSSKIATDPRAVLPILGERAIRSIWRVAPVIADGEGPEVTPEEVGRCFDALSLSREPISGDVLRDLFNRSWQIIWGEFAGYEGGEEEPWIILRAIDSSFCEVETDDSEILDRVRAEFRDVRARPAR